MTVQLLPTDFDEQVKAAVKTFWVTRSATETGTQGGTRDAVIGGKNLDGFIQLVTVVARHCGLSEESVLTRKASVILPGYFRATKNWDVLVIHRQRLLAVFEFKSQVGSFGNNFNNRSEEVIGAATDLWEAYHHRAYRDPRPPFLGWLMLLEDCPASTSPVRVDEPNYPVFPEFQGASYARRYQILCERLMEQHLYGAAALALSQAEAGATQGEYRSLSDATSARTLFAEFAAKVAASNEGLR